MVIEVLLTIFLTYVAAELVGYGFHRLAHVPGTSLYRSHMIHHLEAYPPGNFSSERYLGGGKNSFVIWFVPVFLVFIGIIWAALPFWLFVAAFLTTAAVSIANLYMHDRYHLLGSWIPESLRTTHEVHHNNMRRNFGIYLFVWDRVFGTFRTPEEEARRRRDRTSRPHAS